MKATKNTSKVNVIVTVANGIFNEIKGLAEGTVLTGTFNPVNKAFDFKWNGLDAVLWVGQDCEIETNLCRKSKKASIRLREAIRSLLAPGETRALSHPVVCSFNWASAFEVSNLELSPKGIVGVSDSVGNAPYMKELSETDCEAILAAI